MGERTRRGEKDQAEDAAAAALNRRATMCVFGCLFALGCRSNVIRRLAFYPPCPGYSFGPNGEFFLSDGSAAHSSSSQQQQQQGGHQQQQQGCGGEGQQQQQRGAQHQNGGGLHPRQQKEMQEQMLVGHQQQQQSGSKGFSPPPEDIVNPAQQQQQLTASAAVAAAVSAPLDRDSRCCSCSCVQEQQQQQQRGAGRDGAAAAAKGDEGGAAGGRESMQDLLRRAGLPEQVEVLKIRNKRRGLASRNDEFIAAIFLYLPWSAAAAAAGGRADNTSCFPRREGQQGSTSPPSWRTPSPAAARSYSPPIAANDSAAAASCGATAQQGGAAAGAWPSTAAADGEEAPAAGAAAARRIAAKGNKRLSLLLSAKGEQQQKQRTIPSAAEAAAAEKRQLMLESAKRRPCIIFSHGNSTDIGYMFPLYYRLVYKCRVNVLAYDYRGYGRSTGKTSEQSLYTDIRLVWQYATQVLCIPPANIILYGHSLGSAPCCDLALREKTYPVGGVILHSSISSGLRLFIDDIEKSPWFDAFPNVEKLRKVYQTPILIVHGKLDRQIFWTHSQRLELAAREADEAVRRAKEQQRQRDLSSANNEKSSRAAPATGTAATSGSDSAGTPSDPDPLEQLRPLRVQTWWVATADHNDVEQKTGDLYYQRIDEFIRFCRTWAAARHLNPINN